MCRSTSPTCAARTVRPRPTPALADSARRSRARRWYGAVAELVILQSEHVQWFEALPKTFKRALPARHSIVDLDLDELIVVLRPRGFGRD
jgi:hypothetical protein